MTIIVHGSTISAYTNRVLITLAELGVDDFEFKRMDFSKREHCSPEFVKLQPFAQVPVLQDDDLTIFESRAITKYLAEKFEGQGTPLFGKTLKEKAMVYQWMEVESQNYGPPIHIISMEVLFNPMSGGKTNVDLVTEQLAKLDKVLDVYEAHLAKNKYLAGDFFSLADLNHLPGTHILINLVKKGDGITSRPHLNAWWNDISSRPSFQKVLAMK